MSYSKEETHELRYKIRHALVFRTGRMTDRDGNLKEWVLKRLERLTAVAFTDKTGIRQIDLIRSRRVWDHGWTILEIADKERVKATTVENSLNRVLNAIIDKMPRGMAMAVLQPVSEAERLNMPEWKKKRWRLKGCTKVVDGYICRGDQHRDEDGAYAMGPEWTCLMCGKRDIIGRVWEK